MPSENESIINGQKYLCRLIIKGQEYSSKNIISLTIREWVFNILPTVDIVLFDDGPLVEMFPLQDNDDIYIELAKNANDANPMQLYFNLSDYKIALIGDNRKYGISLSGYLKANDIFQIRNRSFSLVNSSSVLSTIASESGIIFSNPLLVNAFDNMTWYQINQNNIDFIKHVLERSNVVNDVVFFYANTENKFIYTSLTKEIDKFNNRVAKFDVKKFGVDVADATDINRTIWYNYYDIVNYSSYYNRTSTYGTKYSYYNLTENVEEEYNTSRTLTNLSFKNLDYAGKPVIKKIGGSFNVRNIYTDYFESTVRNEFLINDFFGYSLVLNINAISDVKLFDKINVIIPSQVEADAAAEVISGDYLIGGIIHHISQGGIYQKSISLHRNGMNRSVHMKNNKVK